MDVIERFRHPAWGTAVATALAYGIILVLFTIVFFGIPFLIFSAL